MPIILKLFIWYLLFSNYSGNNLPRPNSESQDPSSNLGRTWLFPLFFFIFKIYIITYSFYCFCYHLNWFRKGSSSEVEGSGKVQREGSPTSASYSRGSSLHRPQNSSCPTEVRVEIPDLSFPVCSHANYYVLQGHYCLWVPILVEFSKLEPTSNNYWPYVSNIYHTLHTCVSYKLTTYKSVWEWGQLYSTSWWMQSESIHEVINPGMNSENQSCCY